MRIGVEHYSSQMKDYEPIQVYFNVPESGEYIEYLQSLNIKPNDRVWVEKNKQICVPCRVKRILAYQFGIQGVEIHEFDD